MLSHPRTLHRLAVASYLGLMALLLAWLTWLSPPPRELISLALVVLIGPLLLPLRGLLHARRYTMAWSTMLILVYFVHGAASAATPGLNRWLGLLEVVLVTVYFVTAIVYIRATGSKAHGRRKRGAGETPAPTKDRDN
ncbi:DUF2069 domain-containing protein [Alkalilimnicola ehrlichii MLHE-1]|uniref:Putative transmembrane protein n=1 Tax=Alkalilimnicola ehrlichii (strain ATCC BAA-1101 / DSM 17681 / MLHE-1) TaxID=187272 RepID=Q0ABB4_ALKEH|nr:DUF2069 domain-containing protein [Alkalilimnicola ehrlichii]ABI55873.1 putative transmembrane protein [Alkalilimnicola ehrlichii MLHE-1]